MWQILAEKKKIGSPNRCSRPIRQIYSAHLLGSERHTLLKRGPHNKMPPTFIFCSVLSSVLRVFGTARVLLSFDVAALDTMGQPLRHVGDCYVSRQRVDLNAFIWLLRFSDTGRDVGQPHNLTICTSFSSVCRLISSFLKILPNHP